MSSFYPINSQPWNTFAVNAGLVDSLSASITGVGSSDANFASFSGMSGDIVGTGFMTGTFYMSSPFIGGVATGTGTATAEPMYFYYGGVPITISDWDAEVVTSPELIQLVNWDNF